MPKMGELYRVVNKEREADLKKHYSEDSTYYSLFIEDESGDGEKTILLTDKEVDGLSLVALPEIFTSHMVLGRAYAMLVGKRVSQLMRLKREDGTEFTTQMSTRLIKKCMRRANKHLESLPRKGWLQDLMD